MTASQLNPERDARAREFESLILNRLLSVGQKTVADAIGVSESTVSRWKEGEIERWCKVLALLELQVVPMSAQCHPPSTSRRSRHWPSLAFRPRRSGLVRWGGTEMVRQRLTAEDYAAMADAAGELAEMGSSEWRRRYNKALRDYYRALSVRGSVAAESRLGKHNTQEA